jgi:hypothetical protein
MNENKFAFYHINRGDFKDTKGHYWLVGYNEGGIGTPLIDLTPDVEWFMKKYKDEAEELSNAVMKDIRVEGFSNGELTLRLKSQATLTAEIEKLKKEISEKRVSCPMCKYEFNVGATR